jgi:hypothetical protein
MDAFDKFEALREVLMEISATNIRAGKTVFNPAATQLLKDVMNDLRAEMGAEALTEIEAGTY